MRLCDFGLSRGCKFEIKEDDLLETTRLSTNYVQTRQYRAPELLLNADRIGKATDMWSVGCIMAELLNSGDILFEGVNTQDQIFKIIRTLGTPTMDAVSGSTAGIEFLKQLAYVEPNPEWYLDYFPREETDPTALDLLSKLLQWDSKKRITAKQALEHEYFDHLRERKVECEPAKKFDFSFEKKLRVGERDDFLSYGTLVKKQCYETILDFNGLEEVVEEFVFDETQIATLQETGKKPQRSFMQKVRNIFKKKAT